MEISTVAATTVEVVSSALSCSYTWRQPQTTAPEG